ncbi:uncharacterized protein [Chlorocebus sabaeus]|uniref:uncharacterized protein n=1 Tax=Chlorocebus sabaeus TaxID=60711 RepID=UPI003BF9D6CD
MGGTVFRAALERGLEIILLAHPFNALQSASLADLPPSPRASIPVRESLFPPQTSRRPAPRPPRLARAAAPSPSRRSPRAGSPGRSGTHAPAKSQPFAGLLSRPGPHQAEEAGAGPPDRRKDAFCGRRPVLAAHTPPARRARTPPPALTEPAGLRPAAGPPPGHRAALALHPAGSCPPRHILTRPPPPFLPAGLAGRREPTPVDGLPRAQARDLRRQGPRAPASPGKEESVRGRGKGTDAEGKGKPWPAAPTRDPLRSGANNSLLKHQRRGQQELEVTSRRRRRRARALPLPPLICPRQPP